MSECYRIFKITCSSSDAENKLSDFCLDQMGDNQIKSGTDANKPVGRQPWTTSITEPSSYKPDHEHGHEDRTGVGLTKTAISHCESRSSNDPMRLTEDNAYHYKNMVSSTEATAERSFPGKDNGQEVSHVYTLEMLMVKQVVLGLVIEAVAHELTLPSHQTIPRMFKI